MRDPVAFARRVRAAANFRGCVTRDLGAVDDTPIQLVEPPNVSVAAVRLLVVAGFHGEEPAGPLAILTLLEQPSLVSQSVAVSFVPLVNPFGFRLEQRLNATGLNTNSGYCHTDRIPDPLTVEGRLLVDNVDRLLYLARNGFLTLHEDCDDDDFYMYSYGHDANPPPFALALRAAGERHFARSLDPGGEDEWWSDAIAHNKCDGSLEDYMFHAGIDDVACTETPGMQPLEKRIACNVDLVGAFAQFKSPTQT